jgi:hypothetical protein
MRWSSNFKVVIIAGDWDVSVRYDGNTFFVFDQILSPSNTPYGLG